MYTRIIDSAVGNEIDERSAREAEGLGNWGGFVIPENNQNGTGHNSTLPLGQ
jgi:hypothetical protein